ncbi:MAG: Electron transport complex subunit RsxB [candidate division WS2 bacterium]|nr:Electron transport complex subunit RsxB [Candidatus Psychracetigena formicireducens]
MKGYMHSITIEDDLCKGCTHCVRNCPTEAIRVVDGKARILPIRCIDCGECIRVCPYKARGVIFDHISSIPERDNVVVLIPPVFYLHFDTPPAFATVNKFIKSLGFKAAYDMSLIFESYPKLLHLHMDKAGKKKGFIPPVCPSVLRLLTVSFPNLLSNVAMFDSPWEISAGLFKKKDNKIKVALLTTCPAQITSIKFPLGIDSSRLDYAIPMNHFYHLARRYFEKTPSGDLSEGIIACCGEWFSEAIPEKDILSLCSINRIKDALHEEEIKHNLSPDIIELWACDYGCAGGILNALSPVVLMQYFRRARKSPKTLVSDERREELINDFNIGLFDLKKQITERPVLKLDEEMEVSLRKFEQLEHILDTLPGIDCGACGAPTCRAFAEDVVLGWSYITDCIFVLKDKLKKLAEEVADLSRLGPSPQRFK